MEMLKFLRNSQLSNNHDQKKMQKNKKYNI